MIIIVLGKRSKVFLLRQDHVTDFLDVEDTLPTLPHYIILVPIVELLVFLLELFTN
jgi:hypothetical protein